MNKKCIKIIFIFLIILYFLSTFCFAEFQNYPDSYNLQQIATNVSSLQSQSLTLQNTVTNINTQVATFGGKLDTINNSITLARAQLTTIYTGIEACETVLNTIEGDTSDIYAQLVQLKVTADSISSTVNNIYTAITQSAQQTQNVISDTSIATQNTITQSAQETQNVITNSTVSDDTMVIDTEDIQVEDTEGVNDFFTSFLNTMKNTFSGIDSSVSTISVPLGFVDSSIELRSDIISSVISGTYISTLVELFWYFVFGCYYIILTKRILDYLSTGQIAVGGVTGFIKFLDGQNQIIKTYMM